MRSKGHDFVDSRECVPFTRIEEVFAKLALKDEVLNRLKEMAPKHVSGEELAKSLGLSRAAIWKAVLDLKKDGYTIFSSPRVGYRLMETTELLLPSEIIPELRTEILGKKGIEYHRQIGSTNDRARELALQGAPEGTVVIAESQISGRGRLGRRWESPGEGGLYFSIILRPNFAPSQAPRITILAGVGLCRAIHALLPSIKAGIKWPNDILIGDKKVAGILTEMEAEMEQIHHVVLGIGINVNTKISRFPKELRDCATSLLQESGRRISRKALLCKVLFEIEGLYRELLLSNFSCVIQGWKEMNLTLDHKVRVEISDGSIVGKAIDIGYDGSLIVKDEDNFIHRISSGEVTILRRED